MPELQKSHEVSHSASDMFDLVRDIEKYPEFVPLCTGLAIKSRREKGDKQLLVADMTMSYKMLSETFTCQVLADYQALKIDVKYIEGPFKHLHNAWVFEALGKDNCCVHFHLDYELRSKMLAMAAGAVFDMAFGRFVDAFEKRANEIYG